MHAIPCMADDFLTHRLFRLSPSQSHRSAYTISANKDTLVDEIIDTLVIPAVVKVEGKECIVKDIATNGFANCGFAQHVIISEGIETVGHAAFSGCSAMKSIAFPSSLRELGDRVILGCESLESITVSEANPIFDSRDGCNAVVQKSGSTMLLGCANTSFPKGVDKIGKQAFFGCSGLESLKIPSWIRTIGDYAFAGCTRLSGVTLPEGGEIQFGLSVFDGCSSLGQFHIPSGKFSFASNPLTRCENIRRLTVASNCEDWTSNKENTAVIYRDGQVLFIGCGETIIPEGIKHIACSAFEGCRRLRSVRVPSSVTCIGERAFAGCRNLTHVEVAPNNTVYDSRGGSDCIIETETNKIVCGSSLAVIPDDVEIIGKYAFSGMDIPAVFRIPANVKVVEEGAFSRCQNLRSLHVPSKTRLNYNSFSGCASLEDVSFEKGNDVKLTDIFSCYRSPFFFCRNLSSVSIFGINVPIVRGGQFIGSEKMAEKVYDHILLK